MSNADGNADVAPANVRVLVRVRPLSDGEKSGGGRNGNGSSILSLGGAGTASAPMDFGQGGGTAGSATIAVNDGSLGGVGGGGYGSGYESDYSRGGGGAAAGSAAAAAAAGGGSKTYHFDAVHGPRSTQADVFSSVRGIVDAVAAGYNGTIVAYGQTGSGKTHTVFGGSESEEAGLIQRSLCVLFRSIKLAQAEGAAGSAGSAAAADDDDNGDGELNLLDASFEDNNGNTSSSNDAVIRETTARASFYEIFNEKVYDLLSEGSLETALNVREDATRGVYVDGLEEVEVRDVDEAEAVIAKGLAQRSIASTSMNRTSSRSHACFVLTVRSVFTDASDGLSKIRTSRFTLVDLAGSERQRSTNATGDRLKEASSINSSLLTLGNVINALVDRENGRDSRHIPFRDSKLTFLLRDSWAGNSKTCLVATVSPAASNASESVSTLTFAQRAKQIKNAAVRNEFTTTCGTVAALRAEVARLRTQLDAVANQSGSVTRPQLPSASAPTAPTGNGNDTMLAVVERRALRAEGRVSALESQLDKKDDIVKSLKRKLQEEQMVQKFKQRRIDYLFKKSSDGTDDSMNNTNQEVEALLGEIDTLRKMLDRPSSDHIEMKVEYDRIKEQLEEKNSEVGPSKFADIERESLEALVNRLTDEKRDLEKRLSSIQEQSSNTQKEVEEILEEVSKLESEMAEQKTLLKKREEELWIATENSAASEAKCDELQAELVRVQEKLSQATTKMESYHSEQSTTSQELESLRGKIVDLQSKLEDKEVTLSTLHASRDRVEEELQDRINELTKSLADSNDNKASSDMELREQLAASSRDNTVLVQRVTDISNELEKQKSSLKESEDRVQKLQDEMSTAAKDADRRLEEVTESHNARLDMLQSEKNRIEEASASEMAKLQSSLEAIETEKRTLQEALKEQEASLNTKITALELELSDYRSSLDKMASESSAALEAERANNLSTITQLEESIASLQNEKKSFLEEAKSKAEELRQTLADQIRNLSEEKDFIVQQMKEMETKGGEQRKQDDEIVAKLEAQIQSLTDEKREVLIAAQKNLDETRTSLTDSIDELKSEKERLLKCIEEASLSHDAAIAEMESKTSERIKTLEKERDDTVKAGQEEFEMSKSSLESKINVLEEEKKSLNEKIAEIMSNNDAASTSSEGRIKMLEDEKKMLDDELTEAKAQSEESAKIISLLEAKAKALEEEKIALTANSSLWQKSAEDSKTVVSDLKDQLKLAKRDKGALEFQLESLSEDQDVLNQTVRSLQDRNDELERLLESNTNSHGTDGAAHGGIIFDDSVMKVAKPGVNSPTIEGQSESGNAGRVGGADADTSNADACAAPTSPVSFDALTSCMDSVISRMSAVKQLPLARPQEQQQQQQEEEEDFDDDDSFDEDMFLPNTGPTDESNDDKNEHDQASSTQSPPRNMANASVAIGGKENPAGVTTPFRKSAKKKRPLSSLKTPADGSAAKRLNIKTPTTTGGVVKKWPTVQSETKIRTGWSAKK